jgi:hypothetical protein
MSDASDNETYLGDGLYASFDGWQFCLRAPRGQSDHVVYLDPIVFASFNQYARAMLDRALAESEAAAAATPPPTDG